MSAHQQQFDSPPSTWQFYPRLLVSRKPSGIPEGGSVARLEARLKCAKVDAAHLARYRAVCRDPSVEYLPVAYPHVLASGLHLAMLSSAEFPVKSMGLVHVRNRIELRRPLAANETGELHCHLEGHRDTAVGQEFDLHTRWLSSDGTEPWSEVCTFLARRRAAVGSSKADKPTATPLRTHAPAAVTASFFVPAGLGRSYGWISGDLNPIHLSDVSARLFGFRGAIAHGMWSLACCSAELLTLAPTTSCALDISFKLPIFMPAWVMLVSSKESTGTGFTLYNSAGEKPHLSGRITPLQ